VTRFPVSVPWSCADALEYATCARERRATGSRSVVRGIRGPVLLKPSNDAHRPRADAMTRQQLPTAGVPSGSERRHSCADETANRRAEKPQGRLVERVVGLGWVGSFMAASLSGRLTRRLPRHTGTHAQRLGTVHVRYRDHHHFEPPIHGADSFVVGARSVVVGPIQPRDRVGSFNSSAQDRAPARASRVTFLRAGASV
jgi:hypothetical protein